MEIAVIGMGYTGIPAAVAFANVEGFHVTGIQRRSKRSGWKIDLLNEGKNPIGGKEPGLNELIKKVVRRGSFQVTDNIAACKNADIILINVQTPVNKDHVPQYDSLRKACQDVGRHIKKGAMVIIESTIAPGTTNYIVKPILEKSSKMKAGRDFNLVYSYERVMVGRLLHNLMYMPRIVGGLTHACAQRAIALYKRIVKAEIYATDCLTAEMAKVTENTYRDVNIAFANEIAMICESLGVNVHEVRRFVNSLPNDPTNPLKNPYRMMHVPGAGAGGHCLPKDPWLLKYSLDAYGNHKFTPRIIVESRRINDSMPQHMKELIEDALKEKDLNVHDAKICILGLAFLGDSDDTRNTPAIPLYNNLKEVCSEVVVHDPFVHEAEGVRLTNNLEEALRNKNCVAIVTNHSQYKNIRLERLKKLLATPLIVDGRNVFNPRDCEEAGFVYRGVGIGSEKKRRTQK